MTIQVSQLCSTEIFLRHSSRELAGDILMNEVQQKILEIFTEIDRICVKHNLRYYAIGGTCLGAVRHQGFIPWDDDLDIAMPEKDFKAFMSIAPRELPPNLELLSFDKLLYERVGFFAKVHDINTTFIENYQNGTASNYSGIYVDIMPLSGMPSNNVRRIFFCKLIVLLLRLNEKKQRPFGIHRTLGGKMLWLFMRPVNCLVNQDFYINLWKKLISKYRFDDSQYTGYIWSLRLAKMKLVFKTDWFGDYVLLPFETTSMRCPCDWNAYLTCHFGDYMKLPPTKEQESHCSEFGIVDLKQSYKHYKQLDQKIRRKEI